MKFIIYLVRRWNLLGFLLNDFKILFNAKKPCIYYMIKKIDPRVYNIIIIKINWGGEESSLHSKCDPYWSLARNNRPIRSRICYLTLILCCSIAFEKDMEWKSTCLFHQSKFDLIQFHHTSLSGLQTILNSQSVIFCQRDFKWAQPSLEAQQIFKKNVQESSRTIHSHVQIEYSII